MKTFLSALALSFAFALPHAVNAQQATDIQTLTRLSEQGSADAQLALAEALLLAQKHEEAMHWYTQAAQQNHLEAQYQLGVLQQAVNRDMSESQQWLERAAQQGHDKAQQLLGFMYQFGRGVEPDMTKAEQLYKQSAEQGNAIAQQALGAIYASRKDYAKALHWFELSAEQGHSLGLSSLGGLYERGEGVAQDKARARELYVMACDAGNLIGCDNLERLDK